MERETFGGRIDGMQSVALPPAAAQATHEEAERNLQRVVAAFAAALGIEPACVVDELAYNGIPEWDSVAHMSFVTEVETQFELMLGTDDVIDMSTFAKIKRILARHGVTLPE